MHKPWRVYSEESIVSWVILLRRRFFFFFEQIVYKLAQPLIKRHLPYMKRFFKDWTVNIKGLKKLLSS